MSRRNSRQQILASVVANEVRQRNARAALNNIGQGLRNIAECAVSLVSLTSAVGVGQPFVPATDLAAFALAGTQGSI